MKRRTVTTAIIIAAAAAVLMVALQHMQHERGEEAVRIDPAVEREIAERDRAILRKGLAAAFPAWIRAWRSRDAGFDPSALRQDGLEPIDPVFDIREDEVRAPLDDEALRPLISPDGRRYLEYGGGIEEGEPDSELTVVDSLKKVRRRLLFYGPSVRIEDAAWADNETVMAVGMEEVDAGPQKTAVQPLVWIFHLQQRLVSTYSLSPR